MAKLSFLIFSFNDIDKALDLIKDVYSLADEIIIIDSSENAQRMLLKSKKETLGLSKLKIFNTVPLGYPDPLRMYALEKCSGEWVFLIDTDERLSDSLKSDIKKIITTGADAFAIKRYEGVRDGVLPKFYTWQTRLFKRKKTLFKGLLHEQAEISGRTENLDEHYYMKHESALMKQQIHDKREYMEIRKYDRFSYKMYNDKLVDDLSRFFISSKKDSDSSVLGKTLRNILLLYETLTLRDMDAEISDFDYATYYLLRNIGVAIKEGSLASFAKVITTENKYMDDIKRWRKESDSREVFEISKVINKIGIIKYLGLDNQKVVEEINKKYMDKMGGIKLLMLLITTKYHNKK